MDVLLWVFIIAVGFFILSHLMGKPDFWKLTRQHPVDAWHFFNNHPAWYIENKPLNIDVVGPFRIVNPFDGSLVKIYCQTNQLESSQKEFMDKFR